MALMVSPIEGRSSFPSTRPSIIQAALDESVGIRTHAIGQLYEMYRRPIVSYLRRKCGHLRHDPDDLVQGFFVDKVIEGRLLAGFQRERGRFRSLLCTTLHNYVRDVCKYEMAQCRNPGVPTLDVDVAQPQDHSPTPDTALELDFVRATIARALLRMEQDCKRDGRMDYWYVLAHRTAAPIFGRTPLSIRQIAEDLGLPSRSTVSNLLINAQRRLRTALRHEIGQYAWDDEDIDREIHEFLDLLSGNRLDDRTV